MKWVARHRYTYMSVYAPSRVVSRWFDGYRRAAAELGYVPSPDKIAFSVPIYVAETDEQAHREARPHVEWVFHKGLKRNRELSFPPGFLTQSSLRGLLMAGMKAHHELTYEELLTEGYAVVGSPESVTARLRELHGELGFGQIIGLFVLGGLSHEKAVTSMELFASQVMPALRSLGAAEPAVTV